MMKSYVRELIEKRRYMMTPEEIEERDKRRENLAGRHEVTLWHSVKAVSIRFRISRGNDHCHRLEVLRRNL